jgi:DNA primase (bacterial type)
MNDRDYVLLEYSALQDGETRAGELCPSCRGGRSGERTLSVTRSGGALLWHCHRASCTFGGHENSRATSNGRLPRTAVPACRGAVGREYIRSAVQLPDPVRRQLATELYLTDKHIAQWQLGWDEDEYKVVQPVKDVYGNVLGCVLRAMRGDTRLPKAKSHTEEGAIAWHVNPTTRGLIIVEDIYSAIRAADYCSSVALLGTHLNEERVEQIKQSGLYPVYLALDADVYPQVIRYAQRFRSQLPMIPIKLTKDLKNHTPAELEEFFNEIL